MYDLTVEHRSLIVQYADHVFDLFNENKASGYIAPGRDWTEDDAIYARSYARSLSLDELKAEIDSF